MAWAPQLSAQTFSTSPENVNLACAPASCLPFAAGVGPWINLGSHEHEPTTENPAKEPATEKSHDGTWLALSVATYTMALGDAAQTSYYKGPHALEVNPIARPFVNLPAPAYFALAGIATTGTNYLAYRMKHSRHRWERRIWWLPQTMQIAGNAYGISATAYSFAGR